MIINPEEFILARDPYLHEPQPPDDRPYPAIVYMYRYPVYCHIFANFYYINPLTGRVCDVDMVGVEANKDLYIKAPLLPSDIVEHVYREIIQQADIYQDYIID